MSLDLNQDLIIITDPPCVVVATMPPSPPPFPPSPPPLPELVDISVSEPGSNQVIVIRANSPYNITGETRMKIMIPDKEKGGLVCVCVCVCVCVLLLLLLLGGILLSVNQSGGSGLGSGRNLDFILVQTLQSN